MGRFWVGAILLVVFLGMIMLAAFDNYFPWFRYINILFISVLTFVAVIEMRRALGKDRIPDEFSWIIWAYGIGIGPSFVFFGYPGVVLFSLILFVVSALTAFKINSANSLINIAFVLVYPGLFMASMLYIVECASTHSLESFENNALLYDYIVSVSGKDVWTILNIPRITYLLPYNALGLSLVFFVSAATDMCAFFVGVLLGKHKLCPEISPKKTVEGAVGGIFGGLLASVLLFLVFEVWQPFGAIRGLTIHGMKQFYIFLSYALIGLLGSAMTQIGDLLASLFKRWSGIKDYSRLLGEHGGVIDRFDGIMLNSVMVALIFNFII
jgi:CDP-diglyceride synthetase